MEEPEDNMSTDDVKKFDSQSAVKKPKKRSQVERELETSLTARVTSPAIIPDAISTSRYGRARRLKTESEFIETQKTMFAAIKSPGGDTTPVKIQSPVYRMHASNSPHKPETPKKAAESYLDSQIDNIYQENISLSRFSDDTSSPSPAKKFSKVYIRKDLIQTREAEESIMLIKNLFSPSNSSTKSSNSPMNTNFEYSTEKNKSKQNGHVDNTSVVKTLDFDGNKKKKKDSKDQKPVLSKNAKDLFELEANCPYQVGDLAWARMGTFPFWPCIVTRDPYSDMFVKKKLFGRVEHDIIHVTFFGDNGRRSWIVDNMLRKYLGQLEFEATREKFTSEDKKKDPRLYAAFFVSEKKQALWNTSVEEAETLLREPKRLRIDLFNEMLWKFRASKKQQKSGKITRTDSDVSLSESLYDSLFSEEEVKTDDAERSKNRSRNKSFDVSEVVTACLDNMAAKTGITKIQRQSHMDRWLQKAKSKTPEKTQIKSVAAPLKLEKPDKPAKPPVVPVKLDRKSNLNTKQNASSASSQKPYSFRRRNESQSKLSQAAHNGDKSNSNGDIKDDTDSVTDNGLDVITKTESLADNVKDCDQNGSITVVIEDEIAETEIQPINELNINSTTKPVQGNCVFSDSVKEVKQENTAISVDIDKNSDAIDLTEELPKKVSELSNAAIKHPESDKDFLMELDEEVENADNSVQDKNEKSDVTFEAKNVSAMEVDDVTTSDKNEAIGENASLNPENVSKESVENNKVQLIDNNCIIPNDTDMKEAQNVTIEASVTETKNEDTLKSQAEEGQQESNEKPTPLENSEKNVNLIFLETNNIHSLGPQNSSTPKNTEKHKEIEATIENSNDNKTSVKLDLEKNIDGTMDDFENEIVTTVTKSRELLPEMLNSKKETYNSYKSNFLEQIETIAIEKSNDTMTEMLDSKIQVIEANTTDIFHEPIGQVEEKRDNEHTCDINLQKENNVNDHIIDENTTMKNADDELNKSGDSESILQLNEINNLEPVEDKNVHLNEKFEKSKSILEIALTCTTGKANNAEADSATDKLAINTNSNNELQENYEHTTRHYVESPTFTQLLDSEEFFRDIKEACDTVVNHVTNEKNNGDHETANHINKSLEKIIERDETTNELKSKTQDVEANMATLFDEEETSDDEPSPEYESFDEDITEDFRKHMMSIESNITDKKDEEQIVKICIEIAEKAKLSPTKYAKDMDVGKPNNKIDTSFKVKLDTSPKITPDTSTKINFDTSPKITLDSSPKINFETGPKDKLLTNSIENLETSIAIQIKSNVTDEVPSELDRKIEAVDNLKTSDMKAKTPEGLNTNEVLNNQCESMINGDSTPKKIFDESIKRYSTRLSINSITKEKVDLDIKTESFKIKQLRKSCELEPKVVIMRLERDKIASLKEADKTKLLNGDKTKNKADKSRLSLKRNSPTCKRTENKITEFFKPEIQIEKSESVSPVSTKKNETLTFNKITEKMNVEDYVVETNISEPVKLNGYHHNVNRKLADTPDFRDDTDFDIDTVSLNSEDSEISLSNSVESAPKRYLRSRPERTLENALKNPEFLKYLELRQDYLMDEHPELNEDEVVSYVYKTWQYEEDLKSDCKKMDDARHLNLIKGLKQETPSRKKSKKAQPKNNLENKFRVKYEKRRKSFDSETCSATSDFSEFVNKDKAPSKSPVDSGIENSKDNSEKVARKRKTRSKSPITVDLTSESSNDVFLVKDKYKDLETVSVKSEENTTPKKTLCSKALTPKSLKKQFNEIEDKSSLGEKVKEESEIDTESISSEESEIPLRQLQGKVLSENKTNVFEKEITPEKKVEVTSEVKEPELATEVKDEIDETASTVSDNEPLLKQKKKRSDKKSVEDPEFIKYLELRQDTIMDENPQLTQDEIVSYLYKTWLYEENSKSDLMKNEELEQANLVKGLSTDTAPAKKARRRAKVEKRSEDISVPKEKPRRKIIPAYYNENFSDIEDELEVFEIFKTKKAPITVVSKAEMEKTKSPVAKPRNVESSNEGATENIVKVEDATSELVKDEVSQNEDLVEYVDEVEMYFAELTKPKPNVFKGLLREKVCEICELTGNLVKCKGCNGTFHPDCVQKETVETEKESLPLKGRKKKRKMVRKQKSLEDSESHSDEKSQDVSADMSIEENVVPPEITFDADAFETQLAAKMKELLETADNNYDSYSSDDGVDWKDAVAGKCEIVDVKLKRRNAPLDYSDFKCNNCQKHDVPVCFVCKAAVSKNAVKMRQKCHVAHCHKYYHLECLDHWPQTQFNSGEPSRTNKKINEFFEALTCPRHVCHTCVSDDPRGCKTRFSGDKLAKCVRCPATYHSFNKCLPAGSQILTASHIICPRHSDPKAAKVPCHVNTGWCFICALGGSLICCEYCPTSFHAECLNIKPPEGNYMCEDCETGRLPLYGEMVWVKLGHYRWWPAKILYPSEIPENIMIVKHNLGDFVVRFFGQYDHYWVNRGRVFPYQEGDSGRISSQKSKIDADFTLAIEHAQRAYAILKDAEPDEEESLDIASSLLPPHYVKLKCNKPSGSLCGRKVEDPSLSLTQCECNPDEADPCGLYSQCLNRMLLTECGPTCRAGDRCNNRAFEKRTYPKLVPYRTPHRGWGLKTLEDIKAGQFVIEYVGELIDEEEFRRRMRRKHEIRDENYYFLTLDKERMIDAGPKGNVARFMNHCCEPNCETQKWTVLGDVRVGLFAINDIPANSEVTFNYNLQCAGIEKKRCLCGAKRCSGYIGAKPKQDESQTKKSKDGKLPAKRAYNKKKKNTEESPSTSKTKLKRPIGRPRKPKELTEIEKDLLIIKNATNTSSDESSRSQSVEDKNPKTLKRKRVSISTEEVSLCNSEEPSVKKQKCDDKPSEVGD